jgi:nucleoside-diphosphate-sugar epimerase
MRVFLTGGSGLLGSHVAERLRARGDDVVCLQRKGSDTSHLRELGCRIVEGNVKDGVETLSSAMEGCAALVHAAALVYVGGPWPRLRAVNVDGTTNVLKAASMAAVPRAVHLSSVAVYGRQDGPVDENVTVDGALEPTELYARSKREAESAARAAVDGGRLQLLIARPAVLYGERDRLLSPRLAKALRMPVLPLMGRGHNTLPIVYAGNAADAVVRILDEGQDRAAYNIGVDHQLTQRELLEGMAHALGRNPRFVHVPEGIVREGAKLGEAVGLNLPGGGDLTLERLARLSLGENPYRTERLKQELHWQPPFSHQEGFRRTACWLQEELM